MEAAFVTGNCTALAGDRTRLAQTRISAGTGSPALTILDPTLGPDTLAMAYRLDDPQWKTLVDWTRELLVSAEAENLRSADAARPSPVLTGAALLTMPLHLQPDWASAVIRVVGNYGEIFARDLGPASAMRLQRGADRLPRDGGLLQAASFE